MAAQASDLQYIKGIGPIRAQALRDAGIHSIEDLLYYLPFDYLDRSRIVSIKDLPDRVEAGDEVTVIGTVFRSETKTTRNRRKIFFLTVRDETGYLTCVFYNGAKFYSQAFAQDEVIALSSVPEWDKYHRVQFIHPEFDRLKARDEEDATDWSSLLHTGAIIPKYSTTEQLRLAGLDNRGFRRILKNTIRRHVSNVQEHFPRELLRKCRLPEMHDAISSVHFPQNYETLEQAQRRIKFDEIFFFQLLLAYRRKELKGDLHGIPFRLSEMLLPRLRQSLPFSLTHAQDRVLNEILQDMQHRTPMNRLLQGDVGSGKTVVALCAMINAVENGYQAALMVPTEVLAEQHWRSIVTLLKDIPVNVRLLVGNQKRKLRMDILEDIRRGSAQIVIGTHALIQEHVEFNQLGLVIIDEQHRFGVAQRAMLREKGKEHPDVLVMTATPIPRTLALTLYGDLDVSVIDELPKGRQAVRTAVRTEKERTKVFEFVRSEIKHGRQVYIVYPVIEESEKAELKAASVEYEAIQKIFPEYSVGLLHGRLSSEEKEMVMKGFGANSIQILVATTVIEVGIDVPNASIMIIENAERFGLSQLHQLRGRVGRGPDQSYCILFSEKEFGKRKLAASSDRALARREISAAKVRFETMVSTNDGFKIAEVDLELRGSGEYFGKRQSGLPAFLLTSLPKDQQVLLEARDEAFDIIARDGTLSRSEHKMIRRRFETVYKEFLSYVRVG